MSAYLYLYFCACILCTHRLYIYICIPPLSIAQIRYTDLCCHCVIVVKVNLCEFKVNHNGLDISCTPPHISPRLTEDGGWGGGGGGGTTY